MAKVILYQVDRLVMENGEIGDEWNVEVHVSDPARKATLLERVFRRKVPRDYWTYSFTGVGPIERSETKHGD